MPSAHSFLSTAKAGEWDSNAGIMGFSMPMRLLLVLVLTIIASSAIPAASTPIQARAAKRVTVEDRVSMAAEPETTEVIVVLEDGADPLAAAAEMGVEVTHVYRHVFTGFAGTLPAQAMEEAISARSVQNIFEDGTVKVESQTVPTGVRRIAVPLDSNGEHVDVVSPVDADIAILDTGVSRVPDLTVAGGTSCLKSKNEKNEKKKRDHKKDKKRGDGKNGKSHRKKNRHNGKNKAKSWQDNNGHGTHTAGIAAAIDNEQDIVGVAPGARIWGVKVLDARGDGSFSNVICGLDWVIKHKSTIDVVNLSLSGSGTEKTCRSSALHRAICSTVNAGIPVIVAAGNQATDASTRVPASYDEVITVSAMGDTDGEPGGNGPRSCSANMDDTFVSFSNFGADIDIAAPGDCILSVTPNGLREFSGTSEATPHVTGAVALFIAITREKNEIGPTPAEIRTWLLTSGAKPQDSPEGFTGDPDGFEEPILWLGSLATAR